MADLTRTCLWPASLSQPLVVESLAGIGCQTSSGKMHHGFSFLLFAAGEAQLRANLHTTSCLLRTMGAHVRIDTVRPRPRRRLSHLPWPEEHLYAPALLREDTLRGQTYQHRSAIADRSTRHEGRARRRSWDEMSDHASFIHRSSVESALGGKRA